MGELDRPLPDSPWGWPLAVYFVLVGVPSGLTLAAFAYRVRCPAGTPSRDGVQRAAAWLALALLGVLGLLLVLDLGRPLRFFLMLTRFDNLSSPISLGAKLIAVKAALLAVSIYLHRLKVRAGDGARPANRFSAVADNGVRWSLGLTSVALAIYPVAVLSRTWVSPLAGSGGAMLTYLVTALLMGAAVLWVLIELESDVERARGVWRNGVLALLLIYAVTVAFEVVSVLGNPPLERAVAAGGPDGTGLALLAGGGVLAPCLALLAAPRGRIVQATSAAAVFAGAAAGRYLIFAVGP